jgi:opacity protein-like surface antigen
MARGPFAIVWILSALVVAGRVEAAPSDDDLAREDRIRELERKVEILTEELERVRTEVAVPTEPGYESRHGYAPAASRIYGLAQGLSIGGYGEGFYTKFVDDDGAAGTTGEAGTFADKVLDRADLLRLVLYLGYKFSDRIVFNSEIEFEHASTEGTFGAGDGSVSVEFASLDFFLHDRVNARAGLLLLPVGFLNEVHEPPFFFGVQRPETERRIIPATWRENGLGLFGRLGESLEYRAYVVNGFNAAGFSDAGVRGGRQNGNRALAEDLAAVARVDWTPVSGLLLGGSFYTGASGQDLIGPGGDFPSARLTLWELHGQYRLGGLHTRALFALSRLANAGALNQALGNVPGTDAPVADQMLGGYVEVAYDVWPHLFESERFLAPFFRVEYVDTQSEVPSGFESNRNRAFWLYTPGLQFKPHPNVVLKTEWRNFDPREGAIADEWSIGFGYAF